MDVMSLAEDMVRCRKTTTAEMADDIKGGITEMGIGSKDVTDPEELLRDLNLLADMISIVVLDLFGGSALKVFARRISQGE